LIKIDKPEYIAATPSLPLRYPRHQMNSSPKASAPPPQDPLHNLHTWKLVLSYDGTDFHGWQVQPAERTVQGDLAAAIKRITGEHVLPQGSGRTDAGVHALGQVASFPLIAPIPAANFERALNRTLPASIRIHSAAVVDPSFHARHSAAAKTYEYRIYRGEICPPFLARYVYALNWPLDLEAMKQAAAAVLGEHDFSSFAATDPDLAKRNGTSHTHSEDRGNLRTIYESGWSAEEELLIYRVRGSGFLHHMVRNLVGTFLHAGRGQIHAQAIPDILNARDRSTAGATAPARGLFLVSVDYPNPDALHAGDATLK
jgi:tRNA pseudouridine38-40 synthase